MARKQIIGIETLQERLRAFEEKYGWPSNKLEMAFVSSPLNETEDFHEWSLLYAAFESAQRQLDSLSA